MGGAPSDFFGGTLRFVGAVLNALFRLRSSEDPNLRMFTSDDVSTTAMMMTPSDQAVASPPVSIQQRVHDEIAALQQIDPDFNDLQFLSQVTAQYQTYLAADAAMSADSLTSIGTPGFVDGYRQCVAAWKAAGLRRVVHDMKMLGSAIIRVSLDGTSQAIVVRFSTTGVRFRQDVDSGTATDGSSQSDSFTEFGTFVRPAGTSTSKPAATGGATHCPSCGAPTTAGDPVCPFCGTQLTGTGSAWLLDKISASAYT